MKVLDLFSGIGGFSLGLERTGGFETVAFCEIEEYPRKILAKHWPEVPIYEDVRSLDAVQLQADGISVDVITAGFPCQDISLAGKGAGIDGERSGLWSEVARLTGELRPRYVILENVAALLGRGLGHVLGDLAEIGYDAEWHCIPASAIGAPHRRDRWWCVAYPDEKRGNGRATEYGAVRRQIITRDCFIPDHDAAIGARERANGMEPHARPDGRHYSAGRGRWPTEPDVGRVAHGVSRRVDRLKGLGNAVVPQIPELIGRAILEH